MARVRPAMPWVLPMGTLMKVSASKTSVTNGQDVMERPSGISMRSKWRSSRYFSLPPASSVACASPDSLNAARGLLVG